MPSLGEAYDDARWGDRRPRQIYAGVGVFLTGALAVVVAITLVTTPLADALGLDAVGTYRVAGVIAGVGVPATFLGVVAVLPSSRRQRLGVGLGTAIAFGGVAMFWHAYPAHWTATASSLAFHTAGVYFFGGALALWFVFATLANSHVRNDPHGTVRLRLTRQGESRVVEVSRDDYRRYAAAVSDGGEDERVVREIESKYGE